MMEVQIDFGDGCWRQMLVMNVSVLNRFSCSTMAESSLSNRLDRICDFPQFTSFKVDFGTSVNRGSTSNLLHFFRKSKQPKLL